MRDFFSCPTRRLASTQWCSNWLVLDRSDSSSTSRFIVSNGSARFPLGQAELDELLAQRDKINLTLQAIIDRQTDPLGIKVTAVEVRDVVLPDSMKRAMAGQAESERERRAKIIP
jgi:hypothetical protein